MMINIDNKPWEFRASSRFETASKQLQDTTSLRRGLLYLGLGIYSILLLFGFLRYNMAPTIPSQTPLQSQCLEDFTHIDIT